MPAQIKFGTSGWRAVMAEEFTFANVRRAVSGIARYVVSQKPAGARVIVGRDPRFLGETFCALASEILVAHGITPLLIAEAAPTPAISYAVTREHADGAINFTASHNPPEYNGIKFSTPDGAPALPEVTQRIEAEIAAFDAGGAAKHGSAKAHAAQSLDPRATLSRTAARDRRSLRHQESRTASGLRSLLGSRSRLSRRLAARSRRRSRHCPRLSRRAFRRPCPRAGRPSARTTSAQKMRETNAHIGIATDGDADRFGIVDQDGTFFQPNYIIALLFDYLVESRGWKNGVAKSVATTNLINALAEHHHIRAARDPGRLQIHRRTHQAGQNRHRRRRKRRSLHPPSRPGKRRHPGRPAVLRDGGPPKPAPETHSWTTYLSKLVPFTPSARTSA